MAGVTRFTSEKTNVEEKDKDGNMVSSDKYRPQKSHCTGAIISYSEYVV